MTVTQRLFTVVGVVDVLMLLWAWSTHSQYSKATDRYLEAAETAGRLTTSDKFDQALMEMDLAASWMKTASEIMEQTWAWTGMVLAGSVVILVIYWILQGKRRGEGLQNHP